jgi:hypothetical protein
MIKVLSKKETEGLHLQSVAGLLPSKKVRDAVEALDKLKEGESIGLSRKYIGYKNGTESAHLFATKIRKYIGYKIHVRQVDGYAYFIKGGPC